MNKRQLFEAIGQVDDDLVPAADRPVVRRRKKAVHWVPLVSAAACAGLLLIGVAGWKNSSAKDTALMTSSVEESAPEAAAAPDGPMVGAANPYADEGSAGTFSAQDSAADNAQREAAAPQRAVVLEGVLYHDTGTTSSTAPDAAPDGTITSTADAGTMPAEDGQSNFGTGYAYRYGSTDGTLEVLIDGAWEIFAANP